MTDSNDPNEPTATTTAYVAIPDAAVADMVKIIIAVACAPHGANVCEIEFSPEPGVTLGVHDAAGGILRTIGLGHVVDRMSTAPGDTLHMQSTVITAAEMPTQPHEDPKDKPN